MVIKRSVAVMLCGSIALSVCAPAYSQPVVWSPPMSDQHQISVTPATTRSPAELQQLVAPIALYPDSLIAQVLAASTYPADVVEADRWIAQHRGLSNVQRADEVNRQSWDPSVKALTAFPSILANMDKNLSWTASLGEAYVQEPQQVMNAIQELRHRAEIAGYLSSDSQQTVTTEGQDIVIQPADPQVVYVPEYDPWLVYGSPLVAWSDWYPYPGLYLGTPGIIFGLGIGLGAFAGFGWGWHHWGFDWARRGVMFNHNIFTSRSGTVINHRAAINRQFPEGFHHFAAGNRDFGGGFRAAGGFHHFGGFQHVGGVHQFGGFHPVGGFSHSGGFQHFAGGLRVAGGFHAGGFQGGGFHGGGFHGGGRR